MADQASERWEMARLTPAHMILCGASLSRAITGAPNLEVAADSLTRQLRTVLWDPAGDRPAAVLARFYRTISLRDLQPDLRRFAESADGGRSELKPETKCLTLMGSAGDEPAWNSRHESVRHRAIPLTGRDAIDRLPMVLQLIEDLGLPVEGVVHGRWQPGDLERLDNRVFYVPDAAGSRAVPDQENFVQPHGVRSVVGFGGPLETGDFWAVILFSRVQVPQSVARLFRLLATDIKIALLPVLTRRLFAA